MRISTASIQESGVGNMISRQSQISRSQEEISTGLRLLKPSDDPAAMAYALDINVSISLNTRYQKNIEAVQLRMNNEDTALESAENILQRIRDLTVTGLNDSYNASDRNAIAKEIDEMTNALMNVGNAKNDKGEYIFSGSVSDKKPFEFDSKATPAAIAYHGDQYQRKIQVGPDIFMQDRHNGFSVFEDIPTADPDVIKPTVTTTTATQITDVTAQTPDSEAQVPGEETQTNDLGAQVTDVGAQNPNEETTVTGAQTSPASSSTPPTRSIFNTLLKIKEAFSSPLADADLHKVVDAALKDIDTGLNRLGDTRVEIGARLNTLDQQNNILGKFILDSRKNLSSIQDADYSETISRFNFQQMALQASQQAYVKVKGLSLFNYL